MVTQLKALFGKGKERGFTLIELLIVILIVGILAAVATPLYLGYVKDAKTAEAKTVAGALWTAVQSNAISLCNTQSKVQDGYPKAGLNGAATADGRWTVTGDLNTLTVDCTAGTYTASTAATAPLFTITGAKTDVDFITVSLIYNAAGTPPSKLECSTDSGNTKGPC
jgi:prepilin-type N-terminal cleavage/methylation domain-containing protein